MTSSHSANDDPSSPAACVQDIAASGSESVNSSEEPISGHDPDETKAEVDSLVHEYLIGVNERRQKRQQKTFGNVDTWIAYLVARHDRMKAYEAALAAGPWC